MSFLYSSVSLHHITPLPAGISFETAIDAIHDHIRLIRADPEYESHQELPRDTITKLFAAPLDSNTKRYRVTDHMPGIPKSLGLPQSITFDCEITDVKNGIDWIVKAPLGLVQKTAWRIVKRADVEGTSQQINDTVEDGGEWALVEDVDMEANRFLINTVKNKCEANWRGIQKKFADHVKEIHNASRSSTQRDIAIAP